MTNREYMESLNDEDLASYLNKKPWENTAGLIFMDGWSTFSEGIEKWLKQENEE